VRSTNLKTKKENRKSLRQLESEKAI